MTGAGRAFPGRKRPGNCWGLLQGSGSFRRRGAAESAVARGIFCRKNVRQNLVPRATDQSARPCLAPIVKTDDHVAEIAAAKGGRIFFLLGRASGRAAPRPSPHQCAPPSSRLAGAARPTPDPDSAGRHRDPVHSSARPGSRVGGQGPVTRTRITRWPAEPAGGPGPLERAGLQKCCIRCWPGCSRACRRVSGSLRGHTGLGDEGPLLRRCLIQKRAFKPPNSAAQ